MKQQTAFVCYVETFWEDEHRRVSQYVRNVKQEREKDHAGIIADNERIAFVKYLRMLLYIFPYWISK